MEGLGQEALDPSGAGDRGAVLRAQFVHAEHRDDVLQLAVLLQHLLHGTGGLIVILAQHVRLQNTGRTLQRVDRGIDAQLRDGSGQNRGRIQVGKGRGRGRVRQVVGRDIDGLNRGDRTVSCGCDALLQVAHLGCQRRLITDGGGHAPQQGRDFGARLGETEDVVDEQQNVLAGAVTEIFRNRQAGQRHAETGSGRLVHLAEDQRRLVDDTGLVHLVPEVVAFTAALAYPGKDRIAAVLIGDVPDQFHDQHRLADARASEEADLTAAGIGGQQVHDLDAGLQHLGGGQDLGKLRGLAVDGKAFGALHRAFSVDGFTDNVEHSAQRRLAHRHHNGGTGIDGVHAAGDSVRG